MIDSPLRLFKSQSSPWQNQNLSAKTLNGILNIPINDEKINHISICHSQYKAKWVDLQKVIHPRIASIVEFDPSFEATNKADSKVRNGVYLRLLKMLGELPNNIGIAYIEGLRSFAQQKEYFDQRFLSNLLKFNDENSAYDHTCSQITPFIDCIPPYLTGGAISMTLFKITNNQKELLDLGTFDHGLKTNNQDTTLSKNISFTQQKNRALLLKAAIKSGFANHGLRWWQFSFGDKVHAYIFKRSQAIYGLAPGNNPGKIVSKKQYITSMISKQHKMDDVCNQPAPRP